MSRQSKWSTGWQDHKPGDDYDYNYVMPMEAIALCRAANLGTAK
jgi:hypothetical protein